MSTLSAEMAAAVSTMDCPADAPANIFYRRDDDSEFRGPFSEAVVQGWYEKFFFTSNMIFRVGDHEYILTELLDRNGISHPFSDFSEEKMKINSPHQTFDAALAREQIESIQRQKESNFALMRQSVEELRYLRDKVTQLRVLKSVMAERLAIARSTTEELDRKIESQEWNVRDMIGFHETDSIKSPERNICDTKEFQKAERVESQEWNVRDTKGFQEADRIESQEWNIRDTKGFQEADRALPAKSPSPPPSAVTSPHEPSFRPRSAPKPVRYTKVPSDSKPSFFPVNLRFYKLGDHALAMVVGDSKQKPSEYDDCRALSHAWKAANRRDAIAEANKGYKELWCVRCGNESMNTFSDFYDHVMSSRHQRHFILPRDSVLFFTTLFRAHAVPEKEDIKPFVYPM